MSWRCQARAWRCTPRRLASGLLAMTVFATFPVLWDAATSEGGLVVKYRVYRATGPDGPYTLLKTVTSTGVRVEVPINETRCYRVKAVDELGQTSPYSDFLCITVSTQKGL